MTTPAWSAAQNGLPGNLDATNASAQVNQLLGTHKVTPIYNGAQVLTPGGNTGFTWNIYGDSLDLDQPFVLSGTTVSRVTLPITPTGNGADVLVSLYSDTGGSPNTAAGAIASTMIPAAVLTQLAAPSGLTAGGPLATAKSNSAYCTSGVTIAPYVAPAISNSGSMAAASFVTSGPYLISVGGLDPISGAAVANVNTFPYLGGGVLAPPVPQPALPVGIGYSAVAIANGFLVSMGGFIGAGGGGTTADVFVASWNENTGTVGTWSSQAALPVASSQASAAGYGQYVYYVGGNVASNEIATVYYALINNGQIASWIAGPPIPVALEFTYVVALNGWLLVIGGNAAGNVSVATTYYSPISPVDGSLGPWQTGPSLPAASQASIASGFDVAVADDLVLIVGGIGAGGLSLKQIQVLSVTADGPSDNWVVSNWVGTRDLVLNAISTGSGNYDLMSINFNALPAQTEFTKVLSVPLISVPLNATGLTGGNTYHVVMQQNQRATAADYVSFGLLDSALPLAAKNSARHSGAWSTITGYSVPMTVYDNTAAGSVRHLVQDPVGGVNQQWTTMLYENRQNRLIGHLETVLEPNSALNSNPTFTSGVSPWTATNGAITQSNTQTHGGFAFSGLLTPTGGFAQASVNSEKFTIQQGGGPFYGTSQWMLVDGWFFSTTGWANFSASVNWYDRTGTYVSTSNVSQALAATTWTHVQNWYEVPATVGQAQITVIEGSTPGASNLVYCSNVFMVSSPECVGSFSSAATVNYPASGAPWPPLGVTQLL